MIRSKFRLTAITDYGNGNKIFTFYPVSDDGTPENQRFANYTPSGELKITVTNPAVHEQWKIGEDYYFDATPVPAKTV